MREVLRFMVTGNTYKGDTAFVELLNSDDVLAWHAEGEPDIYAFAAKRHRFPKGTKPKLFTKTALEFISECEGQVMRGDLPNCLG